MSELKSLYEVTGDIKDINTLLVPRAQLEAMVGKQEPICWAENDGEGGILWDQESCFSDDPAWFNNPMPLYAAPVAQQYEAGDMASAAAQGFRDGVASVAQQPQAEAVRWRPDVCPITRKPFFMWIDHPKHGSVPTYGGPYDSYTIPVRDDDGSFCCERYDHDNGWWVADEVHDVGVQIVSDQAYVSEEAPQQAESVPLLTDESRRIARLQALSEQVHSHSSVYERKGASHD